MNREDDFRELLRRSTEPKMSVPATLEADIMRQVRMRAAARRQAETERPQRLKNALMLSGAALLAAAIMTLCYLWLTGEWVDGMAVTAGEADYLRWMPALTLAAMGLAAAVRITMNVKLENSNNN